MRAPYLLRYSIIIFAILLIPTATLGVTPFSGAELPEVTPKLLRVGFSTRILSDITRRDSGIRTIGNLLREQARLKTKDAIRK